MATTIVRSRTTRLMLTVMLALLAALVAVPAAPAHAGTGGVVCFPVHNGDGRIVDWRCVEIPVLMCEAPCGPLAIDYLENIVLPREVEVGYLDTLGQGLRLVGAAALERNPAVAQRLLDQATGQFLTSARILGDTRVELSAVGFADQRSNRVVADPSLGWLDAAGTDVGNGIGQLQRAVSDPSPNPWIQAGLRSYQSAYQHIANRV